MPIGNPGKKRGPNPYIRKAAVIGRARIQDRAVAFALKAAQERKRKSEALLRELGLYQVSKSVTRAGIFKSVAK